MASRQIYLRAEQAEVIDLKVKDVGKQGAIDVVIRVPFAGNSLAELGEIRVAKDIKMSVAIEAEYLQEELPFEEQEEDLGLEGEDDDEPPKFGVN